MATHEQLNEFICQLLTLLQQLISLCFGTTNGFAGLTNRVVEYFGIFGALADNGFSTALGPPTSLNVGSAGSLGYILVDDIDEVSYTGIVKMPCGDALQGLYVFRSGTITIGPDGEAIPTPALGPNILRASLSAMIAAWREAVDSGDRAQLLMVLPSS
jgi:hypothetical protein